MPDFFSDITLLITHYNRSNSLQRLLQSLKDQGCIFGDIIVSDDGSTKKHLDYIESIRPFYNFNIIKSSANRGLGNNMNKGQDKVKTEYTLYIQEDFVPEEKFRYILNDALELIKNRTDIDIIRFWSLFKYPYLKPFNTEFSEVIYKPWYSNHLKFHCYSDNPHLRRSTFLSKFGRYREDVKADVTEFSMCLSFIRNGGKAMFYNDYYSLFKHNNSDDEPSTIERSTWRHKSDAFITFIRWCYLRYKVYKNSIVLLLK